MIRLLILWALVYFGYRAIKAIMFGPSIGHQYRRPLNQEQPVIDVMIQDPVCGVYFPKKNGIELKRKGQKILFCSEECKQKYADKYGS